MQEELQKLQQDGPTSMLSTKQLKTSGAGGRGRRWAEWIRRSFFLLLTEAGAQPPQKRVHLL